MLHHRVGPTCTISCFSDLCFSQTITRRLWHKNTDNWSPRGHTNYFLCKSQAKEDQLSSYIMRGSAKLLHCFVFTFPSLFSHLNGKCDQQKCQKDVPPLTQPRPNWFVSLYGSQACVSFSILRLIVSTSAQSNDLWLKTRWTHTHELAQMYSIYITHTLYTHAYPGRREDSHVWERTS